MLTFGVDVGVGVGFALTWKIHRAGAVKFVMMHDVFDIHPPYMCAQIVC